MNIVFMGTPEFAVPSLKSLHEEGHNISMVITQKDRRSGRGKKKKPTPIKKKALELGLEVYQPGSINSTESVSKLKDINPDCIVVIAYGQILKKEILEIPQYKCINIHASLLPKYRGAAPINWVIVDGEEKTGITIMEMDEGLDTGDILYQRDIFIEEEDNSESLHDKLSILGSELIIEALQDIEEGNVTRTSQDDKLSSYAEMLSKDTGKIDWNSTGERIKNTVRGLKPWPSAYMRYGKENVKVHKVKVIAKFTEGSNGEVVKVSNEGIFVNCKDSCVVIEELQFPGKKKLEVSQYLNGNQFDTNIKLT